MKETKTTLAVDKSIAEKMKQQATRAGMSMVGFTNLILGWATKNLKIRVEAEEETDEDQGPAE